MKKTFSLIILPILIVLFIVLGNLIYRDTGIHSDKIVLKNNYLNGISSISYNIDENKSIIYGIRIGATVEQIKNSVMDDYNSLVLVRDNLDNLMDDSDIVKTGYKLLITINNDEYITYKLSVIGDTIGNGEYLASNAKKIAKHIVDGNTLENEYLLAADIDNDGLIRMNDVVKLLMKVNDINFQLFPEPTSTENLTPKKVSFNINGGIGEVPTDVNAYYNNVMPVIDDVIITKLGYDFIGWYDNIDYTKGTMYYTSSNKSARNFNKKDNVTLYAAWKPHNYITGEALTKFKRDNNLNNDDDFVTFMKHQNVNGVLFNVYYFYKTDSFSEEEYNKFIEYTEACLKKLAMVDERILKKVNSTGPAIIFMGSYDCDNGLINVGYYTYSAYCNSKLRNVLVGYDSGRYNNDYYENSIVHEFGHAYDFTMRYLITGETGTGITGLNVDQIQNGFTTSSNNYVSSDSLRGLFINDNENNPFTWNALANQYAIMVKNGVTTFTYYSDEAISSSGLEFYAETFKAYFTSSSKKEELYNASETVYNAFEKTLQFSY